MPLSISVIVSEVKWRYAGIPAWREVSNHFKKPLEKFLLDFKDLIISKRSKGIIHFYFSRIRH